MYDIAWQSVIRDYPNAMTYPTHTARTDPATGQPKDWTATQCAAYRGVPRQQWLDDVREGIEPSPHRGPALWSASRVRGWKRPDEWYASECGTHHGCTASVWASAARLGKVPAPVRRAGRLNVWRRQDAVSVEGVFADSLWTTAQCAGYARMSSRGWQTAVRSGDTPQPVGRQKSGARLWNIDEVKGWAGQYR